MEQKRQATDSADVSRLVGLIQPANSSRIDQTWTGSVGSVEFIPRQIDMAEIATGNVYFVPNQTFVASIDGLTAMEFAAGKDDNGDPLVYVIPAHQARVWEGTYKWGDIVDIRKVVKGDALPSVAPNPDAPPEIVSAPGMIDPALKTANPSATPVQGVQATSQAAPSGPAAAQTQKTESKPVTASKTAAKGAKA